MSQPPLGAPSRVIGRRAGHHDIQNQERKTINRVDGDYMVRCRDSSDTLETRPRALLGRGYSQVKVPGISDMTHVGGVSGGLALFHGVITAAFVELPAGCAESRTVIPLPSSNL